MEEACFSWQDRRKRGTAPESEAQRTMIYQFAGFVAMLCLGIGLGMKLTMRMVRNGINRADICSDDKRFIRDTLGIPNE